jgi:PAS domain S-box-containing protein
MEEEIKVIYVDDEPDLLEITRLFLENAGNFQVTTSTSAKNALDTSSIQSFDLIVSDYQMPGMDGITFLKEVRNRYGDIPFILFTGRGREDVVIDAINNGVNFYLQKGGSPTAQFAELAHKIRQAVGRKRAEDSRVKAELDLRESEEKYRSLVDLVPDAVLVHRKGMIVYANPECVRLVGANNPDEIIGKNMLPYIHPDDRSMALEHLRLMKEKGVTIPLVEERLFRLDGRPFTVEITARPVIYQGLPSIIVVFRDITDRKKKEDELRAAYEQIGAAEEELRGQYDELARGDRIIRESEEKYRTLMDLAPIAVLVHREGKIVYANPESVRLAGAGSAEDLIGRQMLPLIHPDDVPITLEHFLQMSKGATIPLTEMRIFTIDGHLFTVEAAGKQIIYEGLPSVIVVYRDITDRKRGEDELRAAYEQITASEEELRGNLDEIIKAQKDREKSEERYRNVIVHAPYGMHFYELKPDRGLVFVGANPGADRILGVSHDQFIGKTIEEAFPGLAGTEVPERYREAAESGTVWQTEQVYYNEGAISGAYTVTAFRTAPGFMTAIFEDITGRKRTEILLRESEERSRRILEQAPLPLAFVRNDGLVTFVNDRFVRLFGYTIDDIPTLAAWWQLAYPDPDYRQSVRLQWEEAVLRSQEEHADIRPNEYRIICKNGEERIMETSGITLSDGFLATFVDLTERKQTEDALLQKTEELDQYFNASLDLFCIAGTDGTFRRLNPEWEKILGYPLTELEGHRFLEFVHPDDLPSTLAAIADLSHQKKVLNFTNRYRHKDGTYRWIEWRSFPSNDRIFAAARDITERKLAEAALRESERNYRNIVENSLSIIYTLLPDGTFSFISPSWKNHLGHEPSEVLGCNFRKFVHPDDIAMCEAFLKKTGDTGIVEITGNDYRIFHKDGSIHWHRSSIMPVFNDKGDLLFFVGNAIDFTNRKHAEDALRESRAELNSILHGSPALQFVIDHDHRILSWNKALEKYSGIPAADVIGTDRQWRAFYKEKRPVLADLLVDNNTDGLFKWYGGKLNHSRYVDGAYEATDFFPDMGVSGTWLAFTAAPIRNADGKIIGAVETLEDITERKRAEEILKQSEVMYREIFNTVNETIWIHDIQTKKIIDVNNYVTHMFGYSVAEALDLSVEDISSGIPPFIQKTAIENLEKAAAGKPQIFEWHCRHKDGHLFWSEVNVRQGTIAGKECLLAIERDITDRKLAEETLRLSEEKYRRILENMQDAYIRTDEEGIISMVNPSAVRMFGYNSAEEMSGIPADSLYLSSGDREELLRIMRDTGGVIDFSGDTVRKDGTHFPVSLNVQFTRDEKGRVRGTEGLVRDITERKSMERVIQETNRKLNLLNSITRHDIVNQLTMLQGFTQLAAMEESDPVISEYLTKIDAGSETIYRQIEFMKTYQELGIHTPGWFRLDETIQKAGRKEVIISGTCRDIEIFSDPMLEKVFFNLFDNAMMHGERVTEIAIRCERAPDGIIIIVEDNGIGIPQGEKEKIFEKGFGKNTGLGLFLVKEILSITSITIRESGTPGKGAKFEITVPKGQFRSAL